MIFQRIHQFDQRVRERLVRVADTAARFDEHGIVEWAQRAAADAQALGRLRDRDVANLERLEDTFDNDFYRGQPTDCIGGVSGALSAFA